MVKSCCAFNCKNRFGKESEDGKKVRFHRFPLKNPMLCKKWVIALKRKDFIPTRHTLICGEHFTSEHYRTDPCKERLHLKRDAIPSVFNFTDIFNLNKKKRQLPTRHHLPKLKKESQLKILEGNTNEEVLAATPVKSEIFSGDEVMENSETSFVNDLTTNTNNRISEYDAIEKNAMWLSNHSPNNTLEEKEDKPSHHISPKIRKTEQNHQPQTLLLTLIGEIEKLSESFQNKGKVKEGLPGWSEVEIHNLSQELSGTLIQLIHLSGKCHIDLRAAVMKKLAQNSKDCPKTVKDLVKRTLNM